MFYVILLVLLALAYLFLMPKDIRRSMDIFVLAAIGVLVVALAISQAVMNHSLILEILMVLLGIGLTIKAWRELDEMAHSRVRAKSRKNKRK